MNATLVIDFDSTIVTVESLDMLAAHTLHNNDHRTDIESQIQDITRRGMEGAIPFSQSLSERLTLFRAHRDQVHEIANEIAQHLSASFGRQQPWIREHADSIHIVSGGFDEMILPTAHILGITSIHANAFVYDENGYVVGVDTSRPTAQDHGKARVVSTLTLPSPILAVGDGYTDYEMKSLGTADYFLAYTENVSRPQVVSHADALCPDFESVIEFVLKLNH